MKVLIAGRWEFPIYEEALYQAFKKLDYSVYKFGWGLFFGRSRANLVQSIYFKFQNKFIVGPAVLKLNRELIKHVKETKPDLIFIYRGAHIFPATIKKIRQNGAIVFGYNNDDPFSGSTPKYVYRHYIKSLPEYDWIFAYRPKNLTDYRDHGFENTSLLRSYYIKEKNFSVSELPTKKYCHDIVFIGHFEDDGREEYIKLLINDDIFDFHLYGTLWDRSKYAIEISSRFGEIKPLYDDYNLALNSAGVALVFLSMRNNDTYTRRCFEIPAAKTFMLSQYTDDLDSMFKEGVEAEYFRDKEEMMDKTRYYLKHDDKREKIALAGYERLLRDGHEVTDRAEEILKVYKEYFE